MEDLDVVFGNIEQEVRLNVGFARNKQHMEGILFAKVHRQQQHSASCECPAARV